MAASRSPGAPSSWEGLDTSQFAELRRLPALHSVLSILEDKTSVYLVGGTVRDLLLGLKPSDFDLACALPPETSLELLSKSGIHVVETGLKHGTITAVVAGTHIEITTFRTSGRAQGYGQTIEQDLAARDFTINAMAYEFNSEKLIDLCQGAKDLSSKTLRAVGNPRERFEEDPLRIMRLVRFGPAAGRSVEAATLAATKEFQPRLAQVSIERIRVELEKIVLGPFPGEGLRSMAQLGLLEIVLPEAIASIGFEQNQFHTQDVFEHTLTVIERCRADKILRFVALFHDLGKPASLSVDLEGQRHFYKHEHLSEDLCKQALRRLRFSNADTEAICAIVKHHMRPLECGPSGLRRIIRDLGDNFETWLEFKVADSPPTMPGSEFEQRLETFLQMLEQERIRAKGAPYGRLAINGDRLIELGLQPGKNLGRILQELEEIVLDNPEFNTPEFLLAKAKELIARSA